MSDSETDAVLADLLTKLQTENDQRALAEIVEKTASFVFAVAYQLLKDPALAEDLRQDVFLVFVERYMSIRQPSRLRAWLRSVTRQSARKYWPHKKEAQIDPLELEEYCTEFDELDPAEILCDDEKRATVQRLLISALQQLSPRYRKCIEMLFIEGRKPAEVAEALHLKTATIHEYTSRALAALAENEELKRFLW